MSRLKVQPPTAERRTQDSVLKMLGSCTTTQDTQESATPYKIAPLSSAPTSCLQQRTSLFSVVSAEARWTLALRLHLQLCGF